MKMVKKVTIIAMICTIVFAIIMSNNAFAYNMIETIKERANATGDANITGAATSIAGSVITIVRVVCAGVAVTMLTVLAMKYMTSAPSEKADIKKHAIVYVVGAVVMFACTAILGIIQKFATNIS